MKNLSNNERKTIEKLGTNLSRIYQFKVPEMLKVNEGFHHDLNANDKVELRGPAFPCKISRIFEHKTAFLCKARGVI